MLPFLTLLTSILSFIPNSIYSIMHSKSNGDRVGSHSFLELCKCNYFNINRLVPTPVVRLSMLTPIPTGRIQGDGGGLGIRIPLLVICGGGGGGGTPKFPHEEKHVAPMDRDLVLSSFSDPAFPKVCISPWRLLQGR